MHTNRHTAHYEVFLNKTLGLWRVVQGELLSSMQGGPQKRPLQERGRLLGRHLVQHGNVQIRAGCALPNHALRATCSSYFHRHVRAEPLLLHQPSTSLSWDAWKVLLWEQRPRASALLKYFWIQSDAWSVESSQLDKIRYFDASSRVVRKFMKVDVYDWQGASVLNRKT